MNEGVLPLPCRTLVIKKKIKIFEKLKTNVHLKILLILERI